jgi:hypothetical protein
MQVSIASRKILDLHSEPHKSSENEILRGAQDDTRKIGATNRRCHSEARSASRIGKLGLQAHSARISFIVMRHECLRST